MTRPTRPEDDAPGGLSPDQEEAFFSTGPEDPDPMGIAQRSAKRAAARRSRGRVMFFVFLAFLVLLSVLLWSELVYFFRSPEPLDLGRAEALKMRALPNNAYVRVEGVARDMCIRAEVFSERYRYLYLLGSELGARILIQAPDPGGGCVGAVERVFEGRLQDLARTDRYEAVARYYRDKFPSAPRQGPLYLLEHGVRPRQAWYYPAILALLLALAVTNFLLRRRARRRATDAPTEGG